MFCTICGNEINDKFYLSVNSFEDKILFHIDCIENIKVEKINKNESYLKCENCGQDLTYKELYVYRDEKTILHYYDYKCFYENPKLSRMKSLERIIKDINSYGYDRHVCVLCGKLDYDINLLEYKSLDGLVSYYHESCL